MRGRWSHRGAEFQNSRTATPRWKRRGAVYSSIEEEGGGEEKIERRIRYYGRFGGTRRRQSRRTQGKRRRGNYIASGRPIELDNSQFNTRQHSLKRYFLVFDLCHLFPCTHSFHREFTRTKSPSRDSMPDNLENYLIFHIVSLLQTNKHWLSRETRGYQYSIEDECRVFSNGKKGKHTEMCVTVEVLEVSAGWRFKCSCRYSYDSVRRGGCQGKFECLENVHISLVRMSIFSARALW